MKKMLLIIGLVLVFGLLLGGCAPQKADSTTKAESAKKAEVKDAEPVLVKDETKAEPEKVETKEEAESSKTETKPVEKTTKAVAKPDISQEELDALKTSIEGIETDDLGGLSND